MPSRLRSVGWACDASTCRPTAAPRDGMPPKTRPRDGMPPKNGTRARHADPKTSPRDGMPPSGVPNMRQDASPWRRFFRAETGIFLGVWLA